jgi:dimethylaniline monooxygenase (N-oxide forming)
MKSTIINTSKEMTAYSDFPPPDHFANYMHHSEFLEYLELYAQKYDLYSYIRFKHKVIQIKRAQDYIETGRWVVELLNSRGEHQEEEFDCVLLAQGHNSIPNFEHVKYPNQDRFQRKIMHASEYKFPTEEFEDKINVVLGIGNSAVDIAVELSRVGKKVLFE